MTPSDPRPPLADAALRGAPSRMLSAALIALLCMIWGSTWLAIKYGLRDLPPLTSVGVRFGVAAVAMTGLAAVLSRREGGGKPRPLLWITLGSTNFAASYCIVYLSETALPSGLVSVLWSVFPMMMAVCGHLWLPGERLRPGHWAGFALGFAGILLLFRTDLRALGPEAVPMAALLLLSPLVTALGTTVIKRHGREASSLLVNRNALYLATALLVGPVLWFEGDAAVAWTPRAVIATLYLALVGTVTTFGLYFWLLRHTAAHRMGLIAYVTPPIALFLGALFGGEPITPYTIAGTALILCGVVAVVRS